jgi:hypothetical protein
MDGGNGSEAGPDNKTDEDPCSKLSSCAVVGIEGATLVSVSIRRALPFPDTGSMSGERRRLAGRVGRGARRVVLKNH